MALSFSRSLFHGSKKVVFPKGKLLGPFSSTVVNCFSESESDHSIDASKESEFFLENHESKQSFGQKNIKFEVSQLKTWSIEGRLNLFPEYQRDFVWKTNCASRLIVTVLCNRLIPAVVLHEKRKGCYDVVDGKQRLNTILSFCGLESVKDSEGKPRKFPKLKKLEKLGEGYDELNNLSFNDLSPNRKLAFESYAINCTVIPLETPQKDVFDIYDDINSGGEDMKPQQIRRAVFYGPYIKLLDKLALNKDFQFIYNPRAWDKYELDPKESDREMILRALAFSSDGWKKFKTSLKSFLNQELLSVGNLEESQVTEILEKKKKMFERVMKVGREVFREGAFRKWEQSKPGNWQFSKAISLPLWDSLCSVLEELLVLGYKELDFRKNQETINKVVKNLFEEEILVLSNRATKKQIDIWRSILKSAIKSALDNDKRSF